MSSTAVVVAIGVTCVATVLGGIHGVRLSRTTSDFYVAGRAVGPWRNASAVGGEYLSAASFLGIAGLVYASGVSMLWFPVGYTIGYVVLAALIAAPMRRSGAYTIPDFADLRLRSQRLRLLTSMFVLVIGWLYLLPQLQGAGLAVETLTGGPAWVGSALVALVVTVNVVSGGMRSVTDLQAVQYWVKLVAIAVPAVVLLALWFREGSPMPTMPAPIPESVGVETYTTYSLLLALCLGTMGLPHVVVRFYTSGDGRAARRTILPVVALLGLFYLFPPVYAVLGRVHLPDLPPGTQADEIVLTLPGVAAPGIVGDTLLVILAVGAFAAFLSTSSGLAIALTGVIDQDLVRPRLRRWAGDDLDEVLSFRISALLAISIPWAFSLAVGHVGLATTVGLAFAVAASTLCPLLVLGVWWRGLTARGIAVGMLLGAAGSITAALVTLSGIELPDPWSHVMAQPAAWTVPLAFVSSVLVSLAMPHRVPRNTVATMIRLHAPEGATPAQD